MVEEKSGAQNGTPNGDMPPQEDAEKIPITDGAAAEPKAEVVEASKNDTKVEVGADEEEEFRGLTKDELMKYSQDPFWKRLRIALMLLFWAGWVAMLVLAIVIIIQAPQCEPPPTLEWVQESPMLYVSDISTHEATGFQNIVSTMKSLVLSSFYLPSLISHMDYYQVNTLDGYNYNKEQVVKVLQAMNVGNIRSVTDYVPNPVHVNHPWVLNNTGLVNGQNLNYDSEELPDELQKVFEFWKSEYNVTGFLISETEAKDNPQVLNISESLNSAMRAEEIVLGSSTINMDSVISDLDKPGVFQDFVMQNYEEWHYYQFKPIGEAYQPNTPGRMNCVTLTLMMLAGTPIMEVSGDLTMFEETYGRLVKSGVEFREKDAIKFGDTQFINNTTPNVVAFTRTMKGTPGYAVVVNLGDGTNTTEVVDFTKLDHVPEEGTMAFSLTSEDMGDRTQLNAVSVGEHEGVVIQFVAQY